MPKIKTHGSTAKRFTVKKSGIVKMNSNGRRHKLGIKTPKRKRQLRRDAYLSPAMTANVKAQIHD